MSLKDDLETIDPENDVQKAFDGANGSNGRRPWTIDRHSVGLLMKCDILRALGPDFDEWKDKGTYSNILRDTVIILWLCSLPDEEVSILNSGLDVVSATASAFRWAEEENVAYCSEKFFDGVKLISDITHNTLASYYAIEGNKPDPNPSLKKNTTRRGKSDSPTTRRSGRATQPNIA